MHGRREPTGFFRTRAQSGLIVAIPAIAQPARGLTAADYARAEKFMGYNTNPLVLHTPVRPTWLAGGRFWYRNITADGSEFVLIDPVKGTRASAFDHARLAAALSAAAGARYDAAHLPFTGIDLSDDGQTVKFSAAGRAWVCDAQGAKCG